MFPPASAESLRAVLPFLLVTVAGTGSPPLSALQQQEPGHRPPTLVLSSYTLSLLRTSVMSLIKRDSVQ